MDKTLSDVIGHYEAGPLKEEYYEKLYKHEDKPGKVFRYVSNDFLDPVFKEFDEDDKRYWIEKEPKQVRMI